MPRSLAEKYGYRPKRKSQSTTYRADSSSSASSTRESSDRQKRGGEKRESRPEGTDLEGRLRKAEDALVRVREKREAAGEGDQAMYDRREKTLEKLIASLKRRLGKEDDLSGPVMEKVGGFVSSWPVVSLLLAALAGALLARR
jgi:hypothetical protein